MHVPATHEADMGSRWVQLAFPVAIALAWIMLLLVGGDWGPGIYAIPLIASAACVGLTSLLRLSARQTATTILLLFLVIFVLSLNFRQRELGDTSLDWQNGTKLAIWCAVIGFGALRWRELISFSGNPLIGLAFLYAVIAVLSATWSEVPSYTAAAGLGLIAYLVLACLAARDLDRSLALRVITYSLAAYLAVGLLAGAFSLDVAWLAPSADEKLGRLQGLSGHPNTFGQQAAILITLTAVTWRLRILHRRTALLLLAIGFVAIAASGSRTNLAAALVAWGMIALRTNPWRRALVVTGLGVLAAFLMVAAAGSLTEIDTLVKSLSRSGSEGEIMTLTGRTELWATAINLLMQKPLLGWGYNGIEDVMARSVSANFEGTAINAHNMLLQSLASMGLLGSLPHWLW